MIPWLSCVCQSCWKISRLVVFVLWFCGYFPLPDLSRKIERDSARRVSASALRQSDEWLTPLESQLSKSSMVSGHPTCKLSQKALKDISRLLVMYKDCLKRYFYHQEEFDLFGNLRCMREILGNDIFISEIASWTLPSKNFQPNHFLIRNC